MFSLNHRNSVQCGLSEIITVAKFLNYDQTESYNNISSNIYGRIRRAVLRLNAILYVILMYNKQLVQCTINKDNIYRSSHEYCDINVRSKQLFFIQVLLTIQNKTKKQQKNQFDDTN